jgi:hypothetical protein
VKSKKARSSFVFYLKDHMNKLKEEMTAAATANGQAGPSK